MTTTATSSRKIPAMLVALLLSTLASFGTMAAIDDTPASAAASGCSAWGAKTVGNIPIAKGVYCVGVNGSRTYVSTVVGSYNAASSVCNWNITAEFFDSNGNWYRTINPNTVQLGGLEGDGGWPVVGLGPVAVSFSFDVPLGHLAFDEPRV